MKMCCCATFSDLLRLTKKHNNKKVEMKKNKESEQIFHFLGGRKGSPETTHHAISDCVTVGAQLWVDVGEEPAKRSTSESGPQGFSLRNVSDVDS